MVKKEGRAVRLVDKVKSSSKSDAIGKLIRSKSTC